MKPKINPKIIVFIGALGVSTSPILVKWSNSPALTIAFYRLLFTVIILTPFIVSRNINEIRNITKSQLIKIAISGIFLGLHFSVWILSLKYTSVASATVLVNISPIILLILSFFVLKEKTNRRQVIAVIFAFVGSVILAYGDFFSGTNAFLGDVFAILGAVTVSVYLLMGNNVRQSVSMSTYTYLAYTFALSTIYIINLFAKHDLQVLDNREYFLFVLMAILPTLLGHSLFNWSLKYVKPTLISMAILTEPIIASILAIFIFTEIPTITQLIGSFIIITSIYSYIKSK